MAALKEQDGEDIVLTGSIKLGHTMIRAGLVDEYRLFVYPVVQGRGRRVFPDGYEVPQLRLVESRPFVSGIPCSVTRCPEQQGVCCCYRRVLADDDPVCLAYTLTGTHQGEFQGLAPTGKSVSARGVQIGRSQDGKIIERWGSSDELGILNQLGAEPRSG